MVRWENRLLRQNSVTDAQTIFAQASNVAREQLTVEALFEMKDAMEQLVEKIHTMESPHVNRGG